jgi:hypothetical protein
VIIVLSLLGKPYDTAMLNWITTHKKWLIPAAGAILLVFLLFFVAMHLQHKKTLEMQELSAERSRQASAADRKQIRGLPPGMIPEPELSRYSLEPSPADLDRRFEAMDSSQRKTEENALKDLKIVWPLYIFSIAKTEPETVRVMLDSSENGFGVIIVTDISLKKYPDIAVAKQGDKIWIAGKIIGVDTHGTGQIALITDYAGFAARKDDQ